MDSCCECEQIRTFRWQSPEGIFEERLTYRMDTDLDDADDNIKSLEHLNESKCKPMLVSVCELLDVHTHLNPNTHGFDKIPDCALATHFVTTTIGYYSVVNNQG